MTSGKLNLNTFGSGPTFDEMDDFLGKIQETPVPAGATRADPDSDPMAVFVSHRLRKKHAAEREAQAADRTNRPEIDR